MFQISRPDHAADGVTSADQPQTCAEHSPVPRPTDSFIAGLAALRRIARAPRVNPLETRWAPRRAHCAHVAAATGLMTVCAPLIPAVCGVAVARENTLIACASDLVSSRDLRALAEAYTAIIGLHADALVLSIVRMSELVAYSTTDRTLMLEIDPSRPFRDVPHWAVRGLRAPRADPAPPLHPAESSVLGHRIRQSRRAPAPASQPGSPSYVFNAS
ncbi:hypothetical protein JB92DRAFT_3113911 [Gautieria morchelliformis]|nr:hypothetical protein JB92DRAFT_3113911 [Gautieria morchelliformis]